MIHTVHDLALVPKEMNPAAHRLVAAVRDSAQRRLVNRKEPLEWDFVIRGAVFWRAEGGVVRLVFATVSVTMWTGWFRFDCTEKLHLKDVKFLDTHVSLFLEKRKTDHYRYGQVVEIVRAEEGQPVCPVDMLQEWVDLHFARGLQPADYLFQKVDGHRFRADPMADCLLPGTALDYAQLRRYLFRMMGEAVGIAGEELRCLFGTQSLRSGWASEVADADQVSDFVFNQYGGWSSSNSSATYKATKLDRRLAVSRSMPRSCPRE
ncbi:hypothetical protein CYMTET_38852 [Cymbomonas tetramitiformis]|uniref:Uncharacterized protein n=1 Tax=Cymbomonas tetramitiformis TaxID=36881 RepID=A0AAE0F4I4_9CHLO|nr:hypothetical protein CYMTET_38852 [Cymbomonas tetramitiformis]